MEKEMQISKYCGYFHDGSVIQIYHKKDKIEFLLCSAEVQPEDLEDVQNLPLTFEGFFVIAGRLTIEGIKKNVVNDKPYSYSLETLEDDGEIRAWHQLSQTTKAAK